MTEKKYIECEATMAAACKTLCHPGVLCPDFKCAEVRDTFNAIPAANVQPVVTCGECIYAPSGDGQGFDLEWPHDEWPENNPCPWKCEDGWYSHKPRPNFFCANGKREEQ